MQEPDHRRNSAVSAVARTGDFSRHGKRENKEIRLSSSLRSG